jgi:uncharacterized protein (TIGR02687 family)
MSVNHIQRSLEQHFSKHRIVFWYDASGEWAAELEQLVLAGISLIQVENNEIGVKFRVLLDEPKQKFLLYIPQARPADEDNWLLDILLSHAEFYADRASLRLQETGLPPEYRDLAEAHAAFFARKTYREPLKAQLQKDETHRSIRRRMMAILLKAQDHSLDAILLCLCERLAQEQAQMLDPLEESLASFGLTEAFWKEVDAQYGYQSKEPSLLDFIICLFQHNAPLGEAPKRALHSQAKVFLSRWKDSNQARTSFELLSKRTGNALDVAAILNQLSDKEILALVDAEVDAYESIEGRLVCWFRDGILASSWSPEFRRTIIEKRARTIWFAKYEPFYEALNHGAELLDGVNQVDFDVDSLDQGIARYRSAWWRIDYHYRKFHAYRRASSQPGLLQDIELEVEKRYLNGYLAPLATRWEGLLDAQISWPPSPQARSRDFYQEVVKPKTKSPQKLFVIISDGLRYECAVELQQRIMKENKFSAELEGRITQLPSYTQLGMASLLPNTKLAISEDAATAYVDGKPATGSANRQKILDSRESPKVKVIGAEDFLNLHREKEGRPMMKAYDAVYIYHNEIDKAGDALATEKTTATACENALDTVMKLIRKATNINASNIVVTSDHGFLFRQSEIEDIECLDAPKSGLLGNPDRRYVTGRGLQSDHSLRVFDADKLGLEGDFQIGVTKGVQRLKVKGSGKRYVHGGAMPQEVIVPVLSVNKARKGKNETQSVDVEIQSFPQRITTMQVAVRLFQKQVVSEQDKLVGRELEVGLYSPAGELVSDLKPVRFELTDPEPRNREVVIHLTLGHEVLAFNNQNLELRLMERYERTSHKTPYTTAVAKFAKPFESEIDEF